MTGSLTNYDALQFLQGMAEYLVSQGVGLWNEDEVYGPRDVGITLKKVPLEPDRLIALFPLNVGDQEDLLVRRLRVQVRLRATPTVGAVEALSEAVFDVLDRRYHLVWRDIEIARILRLSSIPLPADANYRWEISDTYEILTQRRSNT